ncbi:hypothetical protein [Trebonia sp.]|uniref:hypothetical protein n=1 Tax=Trebonia sp. TaxID=2767075 RepID=UPI003BAF38E0
MDRAGPAGHGGLDRDGQHRPQFGASVAAAARAGHPPAGTAAQIKAAIYDHALPVGFSRGFEVSAGIMLLTLIVTIVAIRLTREDLAGAAAATPGQPASAEPAVKPANS